jgi:hypothetical protein
LQEELEKKSRVVKPKGENGKENSAAKKNDSAAASKMPKNIVSHRESSAPAVK